MFYFCLAKEFELGWYFFLINYFRLNKKNTFKIFRFDLAFILKLMLQQIPRLLAWNSTDGTLNTEAAVKTSRQS